ncbi:MAG: hypothetical protein MJ252_29610, partial [archaeon]|nr:hypothetical protein [archaeon]
QQDPSLHQNHSCVNSKGNSLENVQKDTHPKSHVAKIGNNSLFNQEQPQRSQGTNQRQTKEETQPMEIDKENANDNSTNQMSGKENIMGASNNPSSVNNIQGQNIPLKEGNISQINSAFPLNQMEPSLQINSKSEVVTLDETNDNSSESKNKTVHEVSVSWEYSEDQLKALIMQQNKEINDLDNQKKEILKNTGDVEKEMEKIKKELEEVSKNNSYYENLVSSSFHMLNVLHDGAMYFKRPVRTFGFISPSENSKERNFPSSTFTCYEYSSSLNPNGKLFTVTVLMPNPKENKSFSFDEIFFAPKYFIDIYFDSVLKERLEKTGSDTSAFTCFLLSTKPQLLNEFFSKFFKTFQGKNGKLFCNLSTCQMETMNDLGTIEANYSSLQEFINQTQQLIDSHIQFLRRDAPISWMYRFTYLKGEGKEKTYHFNFIVLGESEREFKGIAKILGELQNQKNDKKQINFKDSQICLSLKTYLKEDSSLTAFVLGLENSKFKLEKNLNNMRILKENELIY